MIRAGANPAGPDSPIEITYDARVTPAARR